MGQNLDTSGTARKRVRVGQIVLVVVLLLLVLCLLASLVANVGLGGWALWTYRELRRERERVEILQSEVDRLQHLLQENGVDIPLSPADAQLMNTIEGQVTSLRGLEPMQPVERALMTQDRLYERVMEDFEEDFSPDEARDYALTLAAFGFLDPDIDMYDLLLRLYTEQIAGFYDPETEQIYVVNDFVSLGQLERLTYAHEFTHALQDQYYDLEALGYSDEAEEKYDSEYLSAVQALVEGDASWLEQQFLQTQYSAGELADLMQEALEIDTSVLDATPDIVRESLYFPYEYGQLFVEALYEEGGWAAVDAAYAAPPQSSEHILHPDRYRAGDAPQIVALPPLTDTLGTGWRQVDEDILGEYFLRLYLAQQVSEEEAEAAAEGWGGDRYAVHYRETDGAFVLVLRTVWDTPADAEEFVDAYVTYAEEPADDHPAEAEGGDRLCWTRAADYLCLAWGPVDAIVVLGPDRTTNEALLGLLLPF
jgi:hypothetical protein